VEVLSVATVLLSIFLIGLEGLYEFGYLWYFPDGFLEDVEYVLRVESIFFGLGCKGDELLSH